MMLSLAAETTQRTSPTDFGLGDVLVIAAMGMLIVFTVLILIAVFISALPKLLEVLAEILPETPVQHVTLHQSKNLLPDEPTLAAIGYVLHTELQREVGSGDSG